MALSTKVAECHTISDTEHGYRVRLLDCNDEKYLVARDIFVGLGYKPGGATTLVRRHVPNTGYNFFRVKSRDVMGVKLKTAMDICGRLRQNNSEGYADWLSSEIAKGFCSKPGNKIDNLTYKKLELIAKDVEENSNVLDNISNETSEIDKKISDLEQRIMARLDSLESNLGEIVRTIVREELAAIPDSVPEENTGTVQVKEDCGDTHRDSISKEDEYFVDTDEYYYDPGEQWREWGRGMVVKLATKLSDNSTIEDFREACGKIYHQIYIRMNKEDGLNCQQLRFQVSREERTPMSILSCFVGRKDYIDSFIKAVKHYALTAKINYQVPGVNLMKVSRSIPRS